MFNVSGGEVIIILVLALVVLGPEKLPEVLRKAGKIYGDLRRLTTGFQEEFEETFKEPLREFRETANQARDMVNNPLAGFKEDEATETSETTATSDAEPLPVATGSEPPYAPIVTADPVAADPVADEPDAPFMPPPAVAALLPPPAAPLPPPSAPLWTAPVGQERLDPWAADKATD
jgi:sec-independent protein translocase protein TatB